MTRTSVVEEIIALEKQRCQALLANDIDSLAALLSDRLDFMHANAVADDKASLLAKMREGRIVYQKLEVSEERVVEITDCALLFSRLTADVLVAGQPRKIDNRTLSVWVREQAVWRLVAYQPTPLPK